MQDKTELSRNKYKLPYHWIRDPLHKYSLPYFGYAQIVLDELPPPPLNVLDAGCGDGRIAAEMVWRGYSVTGIDCLELPIIYARNLVPEGKFLVGDLRQNLVLKYGLRERQFDVVTMIEVYEHIPPEDCPTVLANIRQVLQPGGILIVSVPSSSSLTVSELHYRHFSQNELEQELATAGFRVRKTVRQHRVSRLTNWLLSDKVEGILNNSWLQPVVLKRLRRYWYMKFANVVSKERECQRFITIAELAKSPQ